MLIQSLIQHSRRDFTIKRKVVGSSSGVSDFSQGNCSIFGMDSLFRNYLETMDVNYPISVIK